MYSWLSHEQNNEKAKNKGLLTRSAQPSTLTESPSTPPSNFSNSNVHSRAFTDSRFFAMFDSDREITKKNEKNAVDLSSQTETNRQEGYHVSQLAEPKPQKNKHPSLNFAKLTTHLRAFTDSGFFCQVRLRPRYQSSLTNHSEITRVNSHAKTWQPDREAR